MRGLREAGPQLGDRLGRALERQSARVVGAAAPDLGLDGTGLERALAEREPQRHAEQLGVGELLARAGVAVVVQDVDARRPQLLVEPLGATYLDESGREQLVWMGSYGIGPARIAAAAVEQYADEKGISWPRAIAPWDVELVSLGKAGTPEREAGEKLYEELRAAGLDVLFDDRDAGPGEKFADAELLGVPLRLTLGRRSLESGAVEAQIRRGRTDHDGGVPLEGAAEAVADLWRSLP